MQSSLENITPCELSVPIDDNPTVATGTLTSDATNPASGGTITIDAVVYTLRSTLTGAKATQVLTSDATTPTEGDIVTIGSITYTFVEALTTELDDGNGGTYPGHVPYEVLIGASAATALDNLKSAINEEAATLGVKYSVGTIAHPLVTATTNSDTQQTIQAILYGTAANSIATTATSEGTTLSWGAATMANGVAQVANEIKIGADAATTLDNIKAAVNLTGTAGTEYSVGTVIHPTVTATTNADTTQVFDSKVAAFASNAIVTEENATHLSFGAGTLTGGGSTIGTLVIGTNSGLIRRLSTACPQFTGTPTYTIAIYDKNNVAVYGPSSAQNENATTITAVEMMVAPTDYIKIVTSTKVEETLPLTVSLR